MIKLDAVVFYLIEFPPGGPWRLMVLQVVAEKITGDHGPQMIFL
jgi:hypothetical protein